MDGAKVGTLAARWLCAGRWMDGWMDVWMGGWAWAAGMHSDPFSADVVLLFFRFSLSLCGVALTAVLFSAVCLPTCLSEKTPSSSSPSLSSPNFPLLTILLLIYGYCMNLNTLNLHKQL